MKFVDRIAEYIDENKLDLDHLVVILPSVRARKYVEQAIVNRVGKPIFAPEITTIDKWIRRNSTYVVQEKLALIIELYHIHLQIIDADEDASFDSFFTWVPQLLSDMDELEKYLVDATQLFKNLRDIREIERWSPQDGPLTEAQEKYLNFWDRLQSYYSAFKKNLIEKNAAFGGMGFRQVAEDIASVFKKDEKAHFLFAGFNALSLAEMTIMKQLTQMGRGHVLIDADAYYLSQNHHEAGHFLRNLQYFLGVSKLPQVKTNMHADAKEVEIIECSQKIAQVNVASSLLAKMSPHEVDKTLLLLADEDLVGPMIKNLPLNIGKANITMGMQLRNTSIKLWVDLLFSIQENAERFSNKSALYHKDLARLWKHPFFHALLPTSALAQQTKLEQDIVKNNNLFISIRRLSFDNPTLVEFYQLLAHPWETDWSAALDRISQLNTITDQTLDETRTFEQAILKAFDVALLQFSNVWAAQPVPDMTRRVFKQLFQMHYGKATIAYEGNPIEGLQIMGLLETRLLDFDRIICLGMNEGKMPQGNPIQTLIPMDLRAAVGMPTSREKNGLFAHHFYRLLHDVKQMTITYTSQQNEAMASEESRYLLQMELEWKRENKNLIFKRSQYQLDANTKSTRTELVEKTPALLTKIDEVMARSLSASAINKFITCPLDYYYRYLLEYGEEEEVEEELQNNTFGTILHDVLEKMYEPFAIIDKTETLNPQARPLVPQDIVQMKSRADTELKAGFLAVYNQDIRAFETGKNHLSFEMAKKLLKRFLDFELKRVTNSADDIWIYALEMSLFRKCEYEFFESKKSIMLHGKIDRVDVLISKGQSTTPQAIVDNIKTQRLQVIDYKSGKVDSEKLKLKIKGDLLDDLHKKLTSNDGRYIMQLLFYGYLLEEKLGVLPEKVSIVSFISYPEDGLDLTIECARLTDVMQQFDNALFNILHDLYDTSIPFEHKAAYINFCAYCV